MAEQRTAFVTGATGLLGQALCRRLVADGWHVAAVRRRSSDTDALADLDVDWYVADVLDRDALAASMPVDAHVFHLAGLGLQQADAATVYRVNLQGTKAVLDAAVEREAARVLFVSTAGTRGGDGAADETDLVDPVGAYQRAKREAELLVADYVDRGLDALTVHPTSVFGPGDTKFTERLVSLVRTPWMPVSLPGGTSFVGVDDVVDGMVAAMERGGTGEHYILGGQNLTYREALATIARVGGGRAPPLVLPAGLVHLAGPVVGAVNRALGTRMFPFDAEMARLVTRKLFYDSTKAAVELDYHPTPFEQLVGPAVAWYDAKHGRRPAVVPEPVGPETDGESVPDASHSTPGSRAHPSVGEDVGGGVRR